MEKCVSPVINSVLQIFSVRIAEGAENTEDAEGVPGSLYNLDEVGVCAYLMSQKLFLFSKHAGDRPPAKAWGFRKSYTKAFVECRSELDASTEMPTILPSKTIGLTAPNPKEATPS